jgi:hypothetical protein
MDDTKPIEQLREELICMVRRLVTVGGVSKTSGDDMIEGLNRSDSLVRMKARSLRNLCEAFGVNTLH